MIRVLLGIAALSVHATFAAACDGYCHGYFDAYPPVHGYYELPPGPEWEFAPAYYAEPVPGYSYRPAPHLQQPYTTAPAQYRQQPSFRAETFGSSAQPRDERRPSNFDQSQIGGGSQFGQFPGGGQTQAGGFDQSRFGGFDQSQRGGFGQPQNFPSGGAGGGFGSPGGSFGGGGGSFNPGSGGNVGGGRPGGGGGAPDIASAGRVSPGRYQLRKPD